MATLIEMPKLSDTMTTGKVISWMKHEGDRIESGDGIAEVETDKATMELECFENGTLLKIVAQPNESIQIGAPIAIIGKADENVEPMLIQIYEGAETVKKSATPEVKASQSEMAEVSSESSHEERGKLKASPVALRMAAEHNIDLLTVQGSGPGGRIVKRDIEAALQRTPAPVANVPVAIGEGMRYEDIPLTSMRAAMGRRLSDSLGPIPHFYLEIEVDAEGLLEMKAQLQAHADSQQKITITDILAKAAAITLRRHPEVNSQLNGNFIRRFLDANIGIAVAGDGILLVPVIRACQCKSIGQIALERADLVQKGQNGRLTVDEMSGGTFTISNLGMMGITRFKAVINPPQAAILAVGTIRDEPVVKNGEVVPGKRLALTLSCDHRVFDGAEGAHFLETLKGILENPMALCL